MIIVATFFLKKACYFRCNVIKYYILIYKSVVGGSLFSVANGFIYIVINHAVTIVR